MLTPNQIQILNTSVERVISYVDATSLPRTSLFITGGTGFMGIWLLTTLAYLNSTIAPIRVTVLSRNGKRFYQRYPHLKSAHWLRLVEGDVRTFENPEEQFDFVIHGAAETHRAAHENRVEMLDTIINGTRRVLDMAEHQKVKRLLLISSGAVYGPQPATQFLQPDNSTAACDPLSAESSYGEGKRIMELLGAIQQERQNIEIVSARCFTFAGPALPLNEHYAFGNFIRDALFADEIVIKGDGLSRRSYLYGADLAIWILNLLTKGKAGSSYNVGSEDAISTYDLAHRIRDLIAPDKPIQILNKDPNAGSDRKSYVPSISRARALGCDVWTTRDDCIRLTAQYYMTGELIS